MRESFSPQEIRYLKLLRKQYRTIQEASAEVAHLRAVLRLPKGTEHFLSDLHGEHAAFLHILHNASGVIKRKINDLYGDILSSHERDMLSTLIYYPDEKLALLKKQGVVNAEWYRLTIYRLLEVCRMCSVKYTRKRVRDAMPREMGALMEEMLLSDNTPDKEGYYREVMQSILETGQSDAMIIALSGVIQVLAIDRLHIIGDIFDRGPRADLIMDALENYHQVDVQWGNHDIAWMGAAALSEACIAQVIVTSVKYGNLETLEVGYGISLRPLATLAAACYADDPCEAFLPRDNGEELHEDEMELARMHIHSTIIERDPARCRVMKTLLPEATIICADGTKPDVLREEGLPEADALVTLTESDETNLIISSFAYHEKVPKIVTKVDEDNFIQLAESYGLTTIIQPADVTAGRIVEYVRWMQNSAHSSGVETLRMVADGQAEALEFIVRAESQFLDVPLKALKLKDSVLVASIIRRGKCRVPSGNDAIELGDRVVVVTTNHGMHELKDILK